MKKYLHYPFYLLILFSCLLAPLAHAASIYQVGVNNSMLIDLKKGESVGTSSSDNIATTSYLQPSNQLLIWGTKQGSTNITLLNNKGRLSRIIKIEVTGNLDGLKQKLYELLPGENIKVQNAEGKIILSGEVSNLSNMDAAMKLAQAYAGSAGKSTSTGSSSTGSSSGQSGSKTGTSGNVVNLMKIGGGQQVMLEVKIAEISRSLSRKLRLDTSLSQTSLNSGDFVWDALATGFGLFTGSYVTGDMLFKWTLEFSRDIGLSTILAEPNLTTLSGQKASFLSGGEFPYSVCDQQNQDTGYLICTVEFKKFGVGLEFLPTVLGKKINLNTHVSVSTLNNKAAEVTGVDTSIPSLAVREAQTTIELADGQTMSIAGLLSEDTTSNQSQVPGLSDLPMLGSFFRNRASTLDQKELIILVTPHLAKPIAKDKIRLPTDGFVPPDDVEFYLLGKMESRKVRLPYDNNSGGTDGQFGHDANYRSR